MDLDKVVSEATEGTNPITGQSVSLGSMKNYVVGGVILIGSIVGANYVFGRISDVLGVEEANNPLRGE